MKTANKYDYLLKYSPEEINNLLKDIKADELHGFLLGELRNDIFINEPGISPDFRNFINAILDFDQGKTKVLSFPSLYRKSRDSTDVEIKWS